MKAGRLRHLVDIQQKSVTRNTFGEEVVTWATFADDIWASVEPIRGQEFVALRQQGSELTTRIRCRYVSGVTPSMIVRFNGEEYAISEVISPMERDRELELLCVKAAG